MPQNMIVRMGSPATLTHTFSSYSSLKDKLKTNTTNCTHLSSMEINEKALARQKFRSSRNRGRGGRGGSHRGGQYSGPARQATKDLDSNAFRYEDDADAEDTAEVVPRTQGANLEALIEDADVQFNQAFYRFRAQLHDITEEAPPLGATGHPDQLLSIDLEALAASLSALPMYALVGLEPEFFSNIGPEVQPSPQPQPQPAAAEQWRGPSNPGLDPGTTRAQQAPSTAATGQLPQPRPQPQPQPQRTLHGPSSTPAPIPVPRTAAGLVTTTTLLGGVPAPSSALRATTNTAAATATIAANSIVGVADATETAVVVATASAVHEDHDLDELEALLTSRVTTARPLRTSPGGTLRSVLPEPSTTDPSALATNRAPGTALPPALAAAMTAAKIPSSTLHVTASKPATGEECGEGGGVAAAGASLPTTASLFTAARLRSPGPAAERLGSAAPPGVVRLTSASLSRPCGVSTSSEATSSFPGGIEAPSTRSLGPPLLAPATCVTGAVGGIGGGLASAAAPPGFPGTIRPTPVTSVAASSSGAMRWSDARTAGASVVDDELRLLLGLPAGPVGGGVQRVGAAAAASQQHATTAQVHPRLGSRLAATTTTPTTTPVISQPSTSTGKMALPPAQQQGSAKSLDDWLNSL